MTVVQPDGTVEFRFYRPHAQRVHLTGDFNHWVEGLDPMQPQGDGWWLSSLHLDPGEYRFRYVADGQWYTDYASHGVEAVKGGWNAVLVVPPRGPRQPRVTVTISGAAAATGARPAGQGVA